MNLYDLEDAFLSIQAQLDGDEIPEDLAAQLDALNVDEAKKIEGIHHVAGNLGAEVDALKALREKINRKIASREKKRAWLVDNYLHGYFRRRGIQRWSGETFTYTVSKSPPSAALVDPSAGIPPEYERVKTTVEFDKAKALADFKAGRPVPPSIRIETENTHLRET